MSLFSPAAPFALAACEINLARLFTIESWQDDLPWRPFQPGVEIHRLYGDGIVGATAALLRFQPGGIIPLHEHGGYEHILILAGSQRDSRGTAEAGALLINPPGTRHAVTSDCGCLALAIYERPVRFLEI
jgi:anti-sigma factor ChrR (cupin superfamily)